MSKNPYTRRRTHYEEIVVTVPLSAFQTGQADAADGKPYSCVFVNVDDRQDYFMGYNAPVEMGMARVRIPGAGPKHREGGAGRRGRNTRMPAQRTRLNCRDGEADK